MSVVVTMQLQTLLGGLVAARMDNGHLISPSLARKLAARAGVIPAVLGSDGSVIDLGRKTRLFSAKQRVALAVQQRGTCAVEGCTIPASLCDAHHLIDWAKGGRTNLANGALVCPRHHSLLDQSHLVVESTRPGRIRIVRRQ